MCVKWAANFPPMLIVLMEHVDMMKLFMRAVICSTGFLVWSKMSHQRRFFREEKCWSEQTQEDACFFSNTVEMN